jgi:hypothetical protein
VVPSIDRSLNQIVSDVVSLIADLPRVLSFLRVGGPVKKNVPDRIPCPSQRRGTPKKKPETRSLAFIMLDAVHGSHRRDHRDLKILTLAFPHPISTMLDVRPCSRCCQQQPWQRKERAVDRACSEGQPGRRRHPCRAYTHARPASLQGVLLLTRY